MPLIVDLAFDVVQFDFSLPLHASRATGNSPLINYRQHPIEAVHLQTAYCDFHPKSNKFDGDSGPPLQYHLRGWNYVTANTIPPTNTERT